MMKYVTTARHGFIEHSRETEIALIFREGSVDVVVVCYTQKFIKALIKSKGNEKLFNIAGVCSFHLFVTAKFDCKYSVMQQKF